MKILRKMLRKVYERQKKEKKNEQFPRTEKFIYLYDISHKDIPW